MPKLTRYGVTVVAAAAATSLTLLPVQSAGAAHNDGAAPSPKAHHKVKAKAKAEKEVTPKAPPPPVGQIIICNHSGYMFDVFADGPSIREDDLAGSFDECTDWSPVLVGNYQVGFGLRTASGQSKVIIGARFKRDGHVYYKTFNGEGLITGFVNKDEVMRIDLFIPQG